MDGPLRSLTSIRRVVDVSNLRERDPSNISPLQSFCSTQQLVWTRLPRLIRKHTKGTYINTAFFATCFNVPCFADLACHRYRLQQTVARRRWSCVLATTSSFSHSFYFMAVNRALYTVLYIYIYTYFSIEYNIMLTSCYMLCQHANMMICHKVNMSMCQ